MARRDVRHIVKVGAPVDVDEGALTARVRSSCGCNSLWQPPNLALPACATCPDGAVNRFAVDFGYYTGLPELEPEWPFAGTQQLVADPLVACRWATSVVTYEGDPEVDAQWVLDLSVTPPTLTLDVGVHGKITYEMDAPSFGCSCPTPFRKKCTSTPFDLTTPCEVCVYPPFQYCGNDIPIPDTLVASLTNSPPPAMSGVTISLSYGPQQDWGPTWGIQKGWAGTATANNGVAVYMVFDPCISPRFPPSPPNGMLRFSGGSCTTGGGGPFSPPLAPGVFWLPLYSRTNIEVYDLQPVEIGLRGMASECDGAQVAPGEISTCQTVNSQACDCVSFGGATICSYEKWLDLLVTE